MRKNFNINEYQQTHLFKERLEELYDQKLFKLFVPQKYGGLELGLANGLHELIRVASIQGGLGWTLNLGAGANWFGGFLSDRAAQEIISSREAVIAGSGFASGTFKHDNDQFIINGTWSRCTGAHHATFFSLNAKSETGVIKTFVIPREQVILTEEKWQIVGLRNSSSNAILIHDEIVPAHYEFKINTLQNSQAYEVHMIPFDVFARVCMSGSFIGIVKCLMVHCQGYPLNDASLQLIDTSLQPLLKDAEKTCMDWANTIESLVGSNQLTKSVSDKLQSELGKSNVSLFYAVQQLFLTGGLPFVEEETLVHWAYRDVLTAVQHPMVKG